MNEIYKRIVTSPFSVVLGTETSWNEKIKSGEVFGNHFNVFRDARDLVLTQRMSGGGVLIAISSKFNSELIVSSKHKEFEHVWVKAHTKNRQNCLFSNIMEDFCVNESLSPLGEVVEK